MSLALLLSAPSQRNLRLCNRLRNLTPSSSTAKTNSARSSTSNSSSTSSSLLRLSQRTLHTRSHQSVTSRPFINSISLVRPFLSSQPYQTLHRPCSSNGKALTSKFLIHSVDNTVQMVEIEAASARNAIS